MYRTSSVFFSINISLTLWNIANWQLEKSNERKETETKTDLFFFPKKTFWISMKKLDGPKSLWICRTIYDGHFFVEINPIWLDQ